jgi:tetratricopeptide (TPR) repeat protein
MASEPGNGFSHSRRLRALGAGALILCATLAAYLPALRGGLLWDDEGHITKAELRPLSGLWRIWTELGATQQYYPVLHTAFWVEHRLWGDATLGYHLVNILLHVTAACLVALIMRRLAIPGAWLAALIFALHPVGVESVAWIAEQKNTLSTVFYLLAMLAYLRFDQWRRWPLYFLALGWFLLALLSKSVTATLPAALLVVLWWRRGRLAQRDVWPLAPWFALGLGMGLLTTWVERRLIGAEGAEFNLNFVERCLLAGRVVWFYLGKLFWPANLVFIYPRWEVSAAAAWQYVYPAGVIVLLGTLWWLRRRSPGPPARAATAGLAAVLFFVGSLFPALGFFNAYPFVYSYVADHFQYLASLGVIVLVSAAWGQMWAAARTGPVLRRSLLVMAAAGVVGTLGVQTWRLSWMYRDLPTLYRATVERNPDCWMAQFNLGNLYFADGRMEEAIKYYEQALQSRPDYPEAYNNLGNVWRALGRGEAARANYEAALRLKPDYAAAYLNLGIVAYEAGRIADAEAAYRAALRLRPDFRPVHLFLGNLLRQAGRMEAAIPEYEQALRLQPDDAVTQTNLGDALEATGRLPDAIAHYETALQLQPAQADTEDSLGIALAESDRLAAAIMHFERALRLRPEFPEAHNNLGLALVHTGRLDEAIGHFEAAVRLKPDYAEARENLRAALERARRPR